MNIKWLICSIVNGIAGDNLEATGSKSTCILKETVITAIISPVSTFHINVLGRFAWLDVVRRLVWLNHADMHRHILCTHQHHQKYDEKLQTWGCK